ncbi:MAG TPA: magnesium transporter CorA family protein [Candidatus Saccharimonadales bacterium]|jgi:magnesium transporter|nr:magnesium transporter CorA family protein [Candidatus Saccharimonadales bacterium]
MIKYFYKSLRNDQVRELKDYQRSCWVYAEAPTMQEVDYLVKKFDLERGHVEDALDEDEMPRLERENDQSYIYVRFAARDSDGDLITVPLLFIFGPEILITVSLMHIPSLDIFLRGKIDFATTQRAKLVLQILQQIGEHYDNLISNTSKQIKLIRSRLRGHEISNQDFIDFVMIEDELNEFLSSLQPTNATLRRLLLGRYMPLFDEDQDIVEDILLNNEQSVEACNSNLKSIDNIRDAYSSISSHNLNRTMKVLTVATVIIALPNLFYGMYGMNVPLPFQHEPWSYWLILGFTLFLVLFVVWIARRKRIF